MSGELLNILQCKGQCHCDKKFSRSESQYFWGWWIVSGLVMNFLGFQPYPHGINGLMLKIIWEGKRIVGTWEQCLIVMLIKAPNPLNYWIYHENLNIQSHWTGV